MTYLQTAAGDLRKSSLINKMWNKNIDFLGLCIYSTIFLILTVTENTDGRGLKKTYYLIYLFIASELTYQELVFSEPKGQTAKCFKSIWTMYCKNVVRIFKTLFTNTRHKLFSLNW